MGCTDNNDVKLALCQGTIALLNAANGGSPDKCKTPALSGAICGTATSTGTNPFAPICSEATGNSDFANIVTRQVAYCVDNASASGCSGAISSFCQTAEGRKSETLCPSEFAANNTVRATVIATDWATNARNATDNTGLSVLGAVGNNDARTSYINAIARTNGRGTFDYGDAINGVDGVSIIQDSLLLSDFDFVEDNIGGTDGFAFARVDNPDFTDNPGGALDAKARFYAGLLTTTNLGAPLTDTSADGIWDAVFAAIVSDTKPACDPTCDTDQNPNYREIRSGRLIETSSTVDVSFADKTIKTREVDADFTPDPTDFELDGDRITIDGKFNADGVIFGTSSWIYDRQTSHGSVSGLIGSKGAIGAFVSNGQNNGVNSNGEYAGGFIASNRCLVSPFLAACVHESFNGVRAARIAFCRDDLQSTNPLCLQTGVVAAVCVAGETPFAMICGDNMAEKDSYCRDTALSGDAKCDLTRTGRICGASDSPFADICINQADNNVPNQREFCRNSNPNDGTCQLTIWAFCGTPTTPTPANVNLFDSLCNNGYNVARGVACVAGYSDVNCGDDETPDSYIHAYCTDDSDASRNNARDCGNTAYLTANPASDDDRVTVDTLRNKALNPTGTGRLTRLTGEDATTTTTKFIHGGAASPTDADVNFILGLGSTIGLNLGARIEALDLRILTLNGIGNSNSTISGFALATGIGKHYVGLLSGTNLGAPLSDTEKDGIWDAKIRIRARHLTTLDAKEFKLKVDFADKTIKIVNDAGDDAVVSWNHPLLRNPTFTIQDGKFTANGVIYGAANLFANSVNNFGPLTGLIGLGGAVGIFKSNPNVAVNYVGGFVAAPPANMRQTSTQIPDEPVTPEGAVAPDVTAEDFANIALQADGETRLSVLTAVGGNDPYTNYITAIARDIVQDVPTRVTLPYGAALGTDGNLKTGITSAIDGLLLSEITGNQPDSADGVVFAFLDYDLSNGNYRFNHDNFASDLKARFYAGILPTTNLGAPLTDGSADGEWDARFAITYSTAARSTTRVIVNGGSGDRRMRVNIRTPQTDFSNPAKPPKMIVNFASKSIKTSTEDPVSFARGSVIIDGHFTPEGVIYGDSSWVFDGQVSNGSVAGLIGSQGAVGAFISSGANNDKDSYGEYSGGFVAAPRP